MNVVLLCGGSGNRISRFPIPKALYPLHRAGDVPGELQDTSLSRLLRQLEPFYPFNLVFATGFHTNKVLDEARKADYVAPVALDTWWEHTPFGVVRAIREVIREFDFKSLKVILGDTVWSGSDLKFFLEDSVAPITFYHDDKDDRYAETYGLSLDEEGVEIFNRIVDSCNYMQPLSQELAFAGTERVETDFARLGHFERALDFSNISLGFKDKKARMHALRVLDFDDEISYNQVNALLELKWFD